MKYIKFFLSHEILKWILPVGCSMYLAHYVKIQ